jgi:hypothetical protein
MRVESPVLPRSSFGFLVLGRVEWLQFYVCRSCFSNQSIAVEQADARVGGANLEMPLQGRRNPETDRNWPAAEELREQTGDIASVS